MCPREREHEPAQADLRMSAVVVVTIVIFISMENLLFLLCNVMIIIMHSVYTFVQLLWIIDVMIRR